MIELLDAFELYGVRVVRVPDRRALWLSHPNANPYASVTECQYHENGELLTTWRVAVMWGDNTVVAEFGPTFAEAKRNLAKLLSERSREVGHV